MSVPTGAEIEPHTIARTAHRGGRTGARRVPAGPVAAVGVAGLAETGVLLDRRGEPVGPAIAWHDGRGADEARAIASELGRSRFAAQTGVPASALCSLSKLGWQRASRPRRSGRRALARHARVGGAHARRRRRGRAVAGVAHGMLSLRDRAWWPEALEWLGVPEGFLAEPVPAGTPIGRVGDALPAARDAVIAVAGHDHVVAMVGAGATGDGDVLHSSGTADVFVRSVPDFLEPGRIEDAVDNGVTVGWHVVPERWSLLSGNELNVALASVLQMLGVDGQEDRDALNAAAAELGPSGSKLRLEGVGGTGPAVAPRDRARDDPRPRVARGARGGRRPQRRHARPQRRGGGPRGRIVATGGGVRGAAARAVKEERIGPIEWSPVQEATGRGAAVLAGIAAGLSPRWRHAPGATAVTR